MQNNMGINIKKLMQLNSMTQRELADKLNIAQNTVSRYISGSRKIDVETLVRLASIFNVSIDYLLGQDVNDMDSHIEESPSSYKKTHEALKEIEDLSPDDIRLVKDLIHSLKRKNTK